MKFSIYNIFEYRISFVERVKSAGVGQKNQYFDSCVCFCLKNLNILFLWAKKLWHFNILRHFIPDAVWLCQKDINDMPRKFYWPQDRMKNLNKFFTALVSCFFVFFILRRHSLTAFNWNEKWSSEEKNWCGDACLKDDSCKWVRGIN